MNVLAIDTATEILSVALRCTAHPERIPPATNRPPPPPRIYSETRDIGLRHSQVLMPLVSRLMTEAGITTDQLDIVTCTRGPGSFTGLRIGMATAKGLAAAVASARGLQRAPIISVSTLDVIAAALPTDLSLIVPVIDGRKNRFYCAIFRAGKRLTHDLDLGVKEIMAEVDRHRAPAPPINRDRRGQTLVAGGVVITGPHARLFASRLGDSSAVFVDPACRRGNAETLIALALERYETDGPDKPEQGPVYVRSSDAELSRKEG